MADAPGRPRVADIDLSLFSAAEEILTRDGFRSLTIQAVTSRANTTRPTFYRRYSGIPEFLLALLQQRYGKDLIVPDSGRLFDDLLWIQLDQVRMFSDKLVQRSLAGFLDALLQDPPLRDIFVSDFFLPRRRATKDVIARAVLREEVTIPSDLEWICDKLTAPFVMRALFPDLGPVDDKLARLSTEDAALSMGAIATCMGK